MAMVALPQNVTLRNGRVVEIRAICPDDAPRLQALHSRLSEQSIFLRFLGFKRALSDSDARRFANVDMASSMALVAVMGEADEQKIVGVARYAAIGSEQPDLAEAAIVVEDAFQGLGLGTLLLERLVAYARTHGIRAFLASIHTSNAPIVRFIKRSGLPTRRKLADGMFDYVVYLDETAATE